MLKHELAMPTIKDLMVCGHCSCGTAIEFPILHLYFIHLIFRQSFQVLMIGLLARPVSRDPPITTLKY